MHRRGYTVFLIGTLISVGVALLSSRYATDAWRSLYIGLLSQCIATSLALATAFLDLRNELVKLIEDSSVLSRALQYSNNKSNQFINEKLSELVFELEQITKGIYHIGTAQALFQDDIRSIERMKSGETLRTVCPVWGDTPNSAVDQLNNHSYKASLISHFEAAKNGVKVITIYVFANAEDFEKEEVKSHLRDSVAADIETQYILLDDPRFTGAFSMPEDFVIFGDEKISTAKYKHSNAIVGGTASVDPADVKRAKNEFDRLYATSSNAASSLNLLTNASDANP